MNITISKLQHVASMSEETNCFTADVLIDGKKVASVSNRGHGGSNEWNPWSARDPIDQYAKTLPPVVTNMVDPLDSSKKYTYVKDADSVIDELVDKAILEKDFARRIKTRILYITSDNKILQTKAYKAADLEKMLATPATRATIEKQAEKGERCLNFMPYEEAFKLYSKHT